MKDKMFKLDSQKNLIMKSASNLIIILIAYNVIFYFFNRINVYEPKIIDIIYLSKDHYKIILLNNIDNLIYGVLQDFSSIKISGGAFINFDNNNIIVEAKDPFELKVVTGSSLVLQATKKFKIIIALAILIFLLIIEFRNRGYIVIKRFLGHIYHDIWLSYNQFSVLVKLISAILILINIVNIFFGHYSNIGVWDESVYLNTGYELAEKYELWPFGRGPFISLFYSFLWLYSKYFSFGLYWIIFLSNFGKLINFISQFFILMLITSRFSTLKIVRFYPDHLYLITLALYPYYYLSNPSYALYTTCYCLLIYSIIIFYIYKSDIDALIVGISMGLVGLSRPDGLILLPAISVFTIYWSHKTYKIRNFLLFLMPAAICIYGYQFIVFILTGITETGSMVKLYLAFEYAESLMLNTSSVFMETYDSASQRSAELYGTAFQNNWNIFNAIMHNPSAFINREIRSLSLIPNSFAEAFTGGNIKYAEILIVNIIAGYLITLIRFTSLFCLITLFFLHLIPYLITILYAPYISYDFVFISILLIIYADIVFIEKGIISYICSSLSLIAFYLILGVSYEFAFICIPYLTMLFSSNYEFRKFAFNFKIQKYYVDITISSLFIFFMLLYPLNMFGISKPKIGTDAVLIELEQNAVVIQNACGFGHSLSYEYINPITLHLNYYNYEKGFIDSMKNVEQLRVEKMISCIFIDEKFIEDNPNGYYTKTSEFIKNNKLKNIFAGQYLKVYQTKTDDK